MARRVIVEFEPGELPRGRVVEADGRDLPFAGWVQLAAAIDRARAESDAEGAAAPGPADG